MAAAAAFAMVVVKEMLVVVLVIAINGHPNQANERSQIERGRHVFALGTLRNRAAREEQN